MYWLYIIMQYIYWKGVCAYGSKKIGFWVDEIAVFGS